MVLRALPHGAGLRLEVQDDGPGIPEARRAELFAEFGQFGDGAARVAGAGIGLAVTARLAALMGGRIGQVPGPGGRGSVFWLELPLAAAEPTPAPAPRAAPPGLARRRLRLLVVDDIAANRRLAQFMLEGAGHAVELVADGPAAIRAVAEDGYDAVLMDVQRLGMDGLEATRRIRALGGAGRPARPSSRPPRTRDGPPGPRREGAGAHPHRDGRGHQGRIHAAP